MQMRKPGDSGWRNMASHDPLTGKGAKVLQTTLSVPNETFSTISENDWGKVTRCRNLYSGRPHSGHIFPDSKVLDCVDVPQWMFVQPECLCNHHSSDSKHRATETNLFGLCTQTQCLELSSLMHLWSGQLKHDWTQAQLRIISHPLFCHCSVPCAALNTFAVNIMI